MKLSTTLSNQLRLAAAGFVVLGMLTLASCGGEHDHGDHDGDHQEEMHDKMGDEAQGMIDEIEQVVDSVADDARENMEMITSIEGVEIAPGSIEANIYDWMENGEGNQVFILDKIPLEGEESDELSPEGKAQLDALAAMLLAYPETTAEIQGHTTAAKNAVGKTAKTTASGARALWVKTKLSLRGVPGSQLNSKGYGDEQPMPDYGPEDPKQKRIAISLSK